VHEIPDPNSILLSKPKPKPKPKPILFRNEEKKTKMSKTSHKTQSESNLEPVPRSEDTIARRESFFRDAKDLYVVFDCNELCDIDRDIIKDKEPERNTIEKIVQTWRHWNKQEELIIECKYNHSKENKDDNAKLCEIDDLQDALYEALTAYLNQYWGQISRAKDTLIHRVLNDRVVEVGHSGMRGQDSNINLRKVHRHWETDILSVFSFKQRWRNLNIYNIGKSAKENVAIKWLNRIDARQYSKIAFSPGWKRQADKVHTKYEISRFELVHGLHDNGENRRRICDITRRTRVDETIGANTRPHHGHLVQAMESTNIINTSSCGWRE
jgi:hypothetical protein